MSVVLFYHGKKLSAMASDSRCNAEDGGYTDSIKKTFDIHGGLLGVVGDAGLITEVRRAIWNAQGDIGEITKWPKGEFVALYMNKKGRLFEIDCGQIIPHDGITLMGIGVGGDVALGAAEAWMRLNKIRRRDAISEDRVEKMLRFAVSCATAHNTQCGGRLTLKICDLREVE